MSNYPQFDDVFAGRSSMPVGDFSEVYHGNGAANDMALGGAYEGAERFTRETALWHPPMQSADADMLPIKDMADARVRDMLHNDGYVQGGQQLHKDNIVGSMFALNSKPATKVLGLDDKWEEEFQEEVETKFTLGVESTNNWIDASGNNTLTEQVRMAVGIYAARGEFLAVAEFLKDKGRPFQTAMQMVDLDRLTTPTEHLNGGTVRGGIRLGRRGQPMGVYISMSDNYDFNRFSLRHKYIPMKKSWGRQQVVYIREQIRPDQTRGISAMVAGLSEMKITKKFRNITLQNAVANAMYAATIESELPSEAVYSQLGAGNVGSNVTDYAQTYLKAVGKYVGSSKNIQIDGVKIPHLFPGTKLNMNPVGAPGGIGQEFEQGLLRYIASTLGVSYEQLSKDYTKTNYSSARAALTETWKFMIARKKMVADRYATIVYGLWLEEMINKGEIESMKFASAPNFYEGLNFEAYTNCTWIGAGRGQIDELKETQASILKIKMGLSTHEIEIGKYGQDWRRIFAQKQRENAVIKVRGLELVESNSINAASGEKGPAKDGDPKEKEA
jgi:lambda family phage portal protein